jgi:hypothetical protein
MAFVYRYLLDRSYREGVSPLTASLAKEMILPGDPDTVVLACWWIALKFEEVEWQEYIVTTASLCGLNVSYKEMVQAEAVVLQRNQFRIPYHTCIRSIWNLLDVKNEFTNSWLYALLYFGVIEMYTPHQWAQIIRDQRSGKYISVVLCVLCGLVPRVLARRIENRSPRLTLKRKRGEVDMCRPLLVSE